ncbi:hypothetical protein CA7LBN_003234 [Candidozyma auris]|uniref:Uncharacterized protein n=2 Tax=Candidozyma auris TaxID=498019 RepID=A0A8F2W3V0_CANAR|nr:hypothetical protein CA7LBN_003234 [[Candida] auris]
MSGILFEDMFNVDSVDHGRYNKVSRIEGQSSTAQDIKITLDINSELFPVKESDSLTITLASSLGNEDSMITSNGSWRPPKRGDRSLADDYDYVMFGTVYKFEESQDNDKMAVYISFGGLLMRLEGGYRSLSNLKQENAYILIPDPLLQQVPLIKNPAFQPPKPITLNTNYAKLIPNLPASVIPPEVTINKEDIEAWIADLQKFKKEKFDSEEKKRAIQKYEEWLKSVQRKVAPGFDFDIMTPASAGHKKAGVPQESTMTEESRKQLEPDKSALNEDLRNISMD